MFANQNMSQVKNLSEIATTIAQRCITGRRLATVAGGALACAASITAIAGPAQAVSVTQVGNSSVMAAEGPNHSLDFYWQTIGTSPWHREVVAKAHTTFSAPSVAQVGNSSVIAARGPNNSLDFYWQTIGTSPWNPETAAGPGTTFA